jgi:hypothetical protein
MSYRTTGSGEHPAICFVEGKTANASYGVAIRSGGPCPKCGCPADNILAFNPTDSYYYFNCPCCNRWFRWCDFDGNIADLLVVTSTKATPLDIDLDVMDRY